MSTDAQIEQQVDTSGSNSDLVAQASKATKADTHADLSTEQQRDGGEHIADEHSDPYVRMPEWWENLTQEQKAKLAALGAQREGQGEPVAWQYFDAGQWWPTSSIDKYPPNIPTRALYATPQDSVPAWAKELAAKWRYEGLNLECEGWVMLAGRARKCADELESRALALAQTKG